MYSYRKSQLLASMRALAACGLIAGATVHAAPLPKYNVNPNTVTVSGISSGGYMAVQVHVAYSGTFKHAAIFAGGPLYCAEGQVGMATGRCMAATASNKPPTSSLVSTTNTWASQGHIDPTSNLASSKVYIFHGTADSTVKQLVGDELRNYYLNYMPSGNITYNNTTNAEHAWVSPYGPNACSTKADPYISNCSPQDPENVFLTMMYGTLNAKNTGTLGGQFIQFEQDEFLPDKKARSHSMESTGWAYVPANCAAGQACKLHVSFHGCQQYYAKIGDKYIKKAGINEWADTNNIIVLYPQTYNGTGNPNGCWDWWGYDDANYAKKSGRQMVATKAMVDRITSGWVSQSANPAPTNLAVGTVTYSSVPLTWTASSGATGYNVYRSASAGGTRTKVNSSLITGTSYTAASLDANTTYYMVVKAVDSGGLETADSNVVQATTPTAPASGLGAPTGLTVGAKTDTTVPLSWSAVGSASGYNVYMSTTATGARTKMNANKVTATNFTVTGLTASTTYYFVVRTVDGSDLLSGESSQVSTTTNSPAYCNVFTSSTYAHVQAGRAAACSYNACAVGSGDNLGLSNTYNTVTLTEAPQGYFKKDGSCTATPLTPPTSVSVGTTTTNSQALSWASGGGTGLTGYNVYYSNNELTNFTRANTSAVTGTSYTVTGLSENTTYYYYVRSTDAAGLESNNSAQVQATTSTSAVGQVTGLTSTGTTTSSISLSWSAVGGVSGYNVYFADGPSAPSKIKANTSLVTGTTYTITQLAGNKAYYITVRAQNASGVEGAPSTELSATTSSATAPGAPSSLTAGTKTDTTQALSWTASSGPDLAGYNVYRGTVSGGPYTKMNPDNQLVGGTSYTATGLQPSTTYYYVVKAVNTTNLESSASNQVSSATNAPSGPAPVTSLVVSTSTPATDNSITLSWTASTGPNLSYYNVYVATQAGGPYQKNNSSNVTGTSYTLTGLQADTTYYMVVKGVNTSAVEGNASAEVSSKTLPAAYCRIWADNNYNHVNSTAPKRATTDGTYAYAVGSGTNIGLYNISTNSTLKESPAGVFAVGDVCGTVVQASSVASEDGYVKATAAGGSLAIGSLTTPYIGRGTDSLFNRAVLSFDTSALPDGAVVTRAYILLTYSTISGDPWANPAGNSMVIDVMNGTFGTAAMQTTDWAAAPTASAVATVAKWTTGTKQSSDFNASGLSAINKTGKTQIKLRFSSNQTATNYIGITEGAGAKLYVEYR